MTDLYVPVDPSGITDQKVAVSRLQAAHDRLLQCSSSHRTNTLDSRVEGSYAEYAQSSWLQFKLDSWLVAR